MSDTRVFVDDGGVEVDVKSLIEILNSSGPNTRLPKPQDISADMYNLMMRCWQTDPNKRPSFSTIKIELDSLLPLWS